MRCWIRTGYTHVNPDCPCIQMNVQTKTDQSPTWYPLTLKYFSVHFLRARLFSHLIQSRKTAVQICDWSRPWTGLGEEKRGKKHLSSTHWGAQDRSPLFQFSSQKVWLLPGTLLPALGSMLGTRWWEGSSWFPDQLVFRFWLPSSTYLLVFSFLSWGTWFLYFIQSSTVTIED